MKLSLVVPCYNEEGNVERFFECVQETFKRKIQDYEIVFVDDGSRDDTFAKLKTLCATQNEQLQVVSFSRNFGKESAIYAGLSYAKGDYVCIIDADLQQRPSVILRMLEEMSRDDECDCVAAYQEKRKEGRFLSAVKTAFYKFINKIAEVDFVTGASDFRLMKRRMVNAILRMTEYHRFSKGIFSWVGFKTVYIPYEAEQRESGQSKWSTFKLFKYAMEGIVAFSTAPLKLATCIGFASSILSVVYLIVVVLQKLICGIAIPGYATIIVLLLLLGGLILFCLGIIGEYLARMYVQLKNRPIYIERKHLDNTDEHD